MEANINEAPKKEKPQKKKGLLFEAFSLLLKLGWIALSVFILFSFVLGVTVNSGVKMEPAFHDRDIVFFSRFARDLSAGDVVVFRRADGKKEVGRIVAVGGDSVDITENGLKLNGYYQTETYIKGETVLFESSVSFPIKLSQGSYFVLFDSRSLGGDSRTLGALSSEDIFGRVLFTVRTRDF